MGSAGHIGGKQEKSMLTTGKIYLSQDVRAGRCSLQHGGNGERERTPRSLHSVHASDNVLWLATRAHVRFFAFRDSVCGDVNSMHFHFMVVANNWRTRSGKVGLAHCHGYSYSCAGRTYRHACTCSIAHPTTLHTLSMVMKKPVSSTRSQNVFHN